MTVLLMMIKKLQMIAAVIVTNLLSIGVILLKFSINQKTYTPLLCYRVVFDFSVILMKKVNSENIQVKHIRLVHPQSNYIYKCHCSILT